MPANYSFVFNFDRDVSNVQELKLLEIYISCAEVEIWRARVLKNLYADLNDAYLGS